MIEFTPLRDDVMKPGRLTDDALRHICDILDEHVRVIGKAAIAFSEFADVLTDLKRRIACLEAKTNN